MAYRRNNNPYRYSNTPTPVNLHWSTKYSAYGLKFLNTFHFAEMQPIFTFLKSKPYGEYTYDPDNKIWYFDEKWLKDVRTLIDAYGPTIFTVDFQEKPQGQGYGFSARLISVDTCLTNFQNLTGEDIRNLEYDKAKKIYRRACMLNHPDRNGGDGSKMSAINEIWTALESQLYKVRQEPVYEN